jgi:multisubunit Na+/H+ antiporter MnhE subunit
MAKGQARSSRYFHSVTSTRHVTLLWVLLFLGWMALNMSAALSECFVGAVVATIIVGPSLLLRSEGQVPLQFPLRWIPLFFLRIPREILRDTGLVILALFSRSKNGERAKPGRLLLVPASEMKPGEVEESRIALSILCTSLSPNIYVLGLLKGSRHWLVHELVPRAGKRGRTEAIGEKVWWPE